MITANISWILAVIGAVTCLTAVQAAAPALYARLFNRIDLPEGPARLYVRQAGLATTAQGVLLLWAAFDPALRGAVCAVALAGKALFVVSILFQWTKAPGLRLTSIVDGVAVLVLGAYLAGW